MKKLFAAALISSVATTALAQSSNPYYAAVDYGIINIGGSGASSSPSALTASGGYRFTPSLAAEAGYTLIGDVSVNTPGSGALSVSQSILSAAAVGTLPVSRDVNLFGKLGMGVHNGEMSGLPDDLIFGLGGQLILSSRASLRLQYENLGKSKLVSTLPKGELTRFSIGAIYNF